MAEPASLVIASERPPGVFGLSLAAVCNFWACPLLLAGIPGPPELLSRTERLRWWAPP